MKRLLAAMAYVALSNASFEASSTTAAFAVPVRIECTGFVTGIELQAGEFFTHGDEMAASLVYESSVPSIAPNIPDNYEPFIYANHGSATIASFEVQLRDDGIVWVHDDNSGYVGDDIVEFDLFRTISRTAGPLLGGIMEPGDFVINLLDTSTLTFEGWDLPTSLPPLSTFELAEWAFTLTDPSPSSDVSLGRVYGQLTSFQLTVIPEPPAWSLLVISACALGTLAARHVRVDAGRE
jgi:hypothetical protein